jgi:hypothetical protein
VVVSRWFFENVKKSLADGFDGVFVIAASDDSCPSVEGPACKLMDIAFQSRSLRDACESEDVLDARFGKEVAAAIVRRLADLRAATTIGDLTVGSPREFDAIAGPILCVELDHGYRMLLRANHLKPPRTPSGVLSWPEVTRLKVMSIERPDDSSR